MAALSSLWLSEAVAVSIFIVAAPLFLEAYLELIHSPNVSEAFSLRSRFQSLKKASVSHGLHGSSYKAELTVTLAGRELRGKVSVLHPMAESTTG